jgi:RHS repeat-associated protein
VSEGNAVALGYTYYPDGSLETRQDSLAGRDETFTYDAFHRLSTWDLNKNPEVSYHYDDLGNLKELWSRAIPSSAITTLLEANEYGANGKPHALTKGPQGIYTYDVRGRQTTAPGRSLVTYNERDLPTKITTLGGGDTLFAYDAGGARVKKQGPSETVVTLGGLYERRTTNGHHQHVFYVHGGDDGPIAQIVLEQGDDFAKAKTTYLHHDPRTGSVAALTDASGALKESLYYEPFGRRTDTLGKPLASGVLDITFGFTGNEHDDDLGLINFRGRIYDPTIRRFLSADPHVTDPLSGQSYNRYSYVVNNPTNLVDPTGFDWWDAGNGSWVSSDSCIGEECGAGNELTSSGFSFGFGGYSGPIPEHTPSGTSGGALAGGGYGTPLHASEKHRQMSLPTGPAAPAAAISGPVGPAWLADLWVFHFNDHARAWIEEDDKAQRESGAGGAPPALMGGSYPIAGMIPILGLAVSVPSDTSLAPADVGAAAASISGLSMLPTGARATEATSSMRVTQFFNPAEGAFGPGAARALESAPMTSLIDGTSTVSRAWVVPRMASEMNWFSRMMTGRGTFTNYVEFSAAPAELANPGGIKILFSPWQQVMHGGADLAGRGAVFGQLGPNYGMYMFLGGLGAAGAGEVYYGVTH